MKKTALFPPKLQHLSHLGGKMRQSRAKFPLYSSAHTVRSFVNMSDLYALCCDGSPALQEPAACASLPVYVVLQCSLAGRVHYCNREQQASLPEVFREVLHNWKDDLVVKLGCQRFRRTSSLCNWCNTTRKSRKMKTFCCLLP